MIWSADFLFTLDFDRIKKTFVGFYTSYIDEWCVSCLTEARRSSTRCGRLGCLLKNLPHRRLYYWCRQYVETSMQLSDGGTHAYTRAYMGAQSWNNVRDNMHVVNTSWRIQKMPYINTNAKANIELFVRAAIMILQTWWTSRVFDRATSTRKQLPRMCTHPHTHAHRRTHARATNGWTHAHLLSRIQARPPFYLFKVIKVRKQTRYCYLKTALQWRI